LVRRLDEERADHARDRHDLSVRADEAVARAAAACAAADADRAVSSSLLAREAAVTQQLADVEASRVALAARERDVALKVDELSAAASEQSRGAVGERDRLRAKFQQLLRHEEALEHRMGAFNAAVEELSRARSLLEADRKRFEESRTATSGDVAVVRDAIIAETQRLQLLRDQIELAQSRLSELSRSAEAAAVEQQRRVPSTPPPKTLAEPTRAHDGLAEREAALRAAQGVLESQARLVAEKAAKIATAMTKLEARERELLQRESAARAVLAREPAGASVESIAAAERDERPRHLLHHRIANTIGDEAVARAWSVAVASVQMAQGLTREREASAIDRSGSGLIATPTHKMRPLSLATPRGTSSIEEDDAVLAALEKAVYGVAHRLRGLADLSPRGMM
jgi:DNA repair exonuclease SbcCD ATPase subunit